MHNCSVYIRCYLSVQYGSTLWKTTSVLLFWADPTVLQLVFTHPEGALALGPDALDRAEVHSAFFLCPLLACTHNAPAATGPEHCYLLHISQQVVAQCRTTQGTFYGWLCVTLVSWYLDYASWRNSHDYTDCAVQMQTSSNRARVQDSGLITPVKQTGLWLVWALLLVIMST